MRRPNMARDETARQRQRFSASRRPRPLPPPSRGSSDCFTLFAFSAGVVWLRVSPARSEGRPGSAPACARPRLRALPPRRRGLRSSFRAPLRLSRTKLSSASTIPASRSGAWRTAARKRCRQRCAVLGAIPQRSAASLIVSPSASEAPKASQRSYGADPTALCRRQLIDTRKPVPKPLMVHLSDLQGKAAKILSICLPFTN